MDNQTLPAKGLGSKEPTHPQLDKPEQNGIVDRMNNLDPPVTSAEEKAVRRKIDMRLPPFLLVLYMFTWLDRGALGNAALMGIREDLGFSSTQFSLAVSMFFVGTAIADLFTNIGLRYVRPSYYLAGAMVSSEAQDSTLFDTAETS